MSFEGGWVAFGPYVGYGQAYAAGLAAGLSEKEKAIEEIRKASDDKIKEMEMVMSEQTRRIEELEGVEKKLQQEKVDFEKRQMHLQKQAEALQKRVWVLDNKRRCKVLGEKELRPLIERLDGSAKTAQVANVELQRRLQEALANNGELEAKIQELEKRLSEAAAMEEEGFLVAWEAAQDMELLAAWKRSKEYITSSRSIADWRAAAGKGVEVVQRKRRLSEPPRPDEVFDKEEANEFERCCIHEWLKEGLPAMTPLKRIKLRRELFEGLMEVIDVMERWHLIA